MDETCKRSTRLLAVLVSLVATGGCLSYPPARERPVSDDPGLLYAEHREGDKYFNPWLRFKPSLKARLRFMLTANPYPHREPDVPFVVNDGRYLGDVESGASITWAGHATTVIHEGDQVVLTDPHFRPRIFTIKRRQPAGIPVGAIPQTAVAVVSHNHPDHLDAGTVGDLPATMRWLVPLGLAGWFAERGRHNVVELDWWQSHEHNGWTYTCLPAQHWSHRLGMPFNESLWCSWLIDSGERRYYFAGDTGYFHGFREFGRRFDGIDVAILPIGAYAPRAFIGYQHVDPQQAYRAFQDLGARTMLPVHWGTFKLSHEPLDEGVVELRALLDDDPAARARVRFMAIGERWRLPPPARQKKGAPKGP